MLALLGASSLTLTGCPDWLDFSYGVPRSELTRELGRKSTRYQRVEQLLSVKALDKALPDYRDAEYDVARGLRRRDLIDTSKADIKLALTLALRRRDVFARYVGRYRRGRDLLDRCDLEVYTEDDYEDSGGREFVKRWNDLVDAEHSIIRAGAVLTRQRLEYQRRLARALRIALREYASGGAGRSVAAAGDWHDYERRTDDSPWADRYEKSVDRWTEARSRLIDTFDDESDIDELVAAIEYEFPKSFLNEDGGFVPLEGTEYDDDYVPEDY